MSTIASIRFKYVKNALKYAIEANYYLAILISFMAAVMAAVMAMVGNESFLNTGDNFHNPLINNLKIMLAYMVLAEFSVFGFCFIKRSYTELVLVGIFLLLIPGELKFYAQINHLEIDNSFDVFFLYTGLSHLFYGLFWKH